MRYVPQQESGCSSFALPQALSTTQADTRLADVAQALLKVCL